ncbi:hydroxyacylglutathione hydrolase, mitochondrial isoform X1 [Diabrotica undecimpunctata]|uniref:hydroxyacylglutathione hydrolase, mitochondrial isoform X1 n=2 Tax=Diabrotica undecimpunctata TaxID=50387 RepID=UPI003B639348
MLSFLNLHIPNCVIQGATAAFFKAQAHWKNGFKGYHSNQLTITLEKMKIKILPALSDNYMYLISCENTKEAAIVDPVEPDTVLEAVKAEGVNLTKILTTHHHWDHAGGNEQLVSKVSGKLQVFGGDKRIGGLTEEVKQGDKFQIGDITVECLFTPCHTSGHICYYLTAPGQDPAVFTGDTLFIAGCGRFFEGTAEQMYSALVEKLGNLPENTRVFCGHEYTLQNLKFAKFVDKNNQEVLKKIEWAEGQRKKGLPTVPSTIGEEKLYNPFMRVTTSVIQNHAECSSPIEAMKSIRKEKDNFVPS